MSMTKVTSSSRTMSLGGGSGTEYVVKNNDTLEGIAARYDCTPTQLLKMNKLASRLLFPGQKIHVPDPNQQQHETTSTTSTGSNKSIDQKPTTTSGLNVVVERREATSATSKETAPFLSHLPSIDRGSSSSLTVNLPGSTTTTTTAMAESSKRDNIESKPTGGSPVAGASSTTTTANLDPQLDADCLQRFLKIRCKHFTDTEGVVSGVLLVTPNCVMFDPDVSHPLVIENGADRYGMVVAMDTIVSAALYKDATALVDEYGGNNDEKRESASGNTSEKRSNENEQSQQNGATALAAAGGKTKDQNQNSAISSTILQQGVAAAAGNGSNTSLPSSSNVADGSSSVPTSSAADNDARRAELERELALMTLTPDYKTVLRRHVSDSGPQEEIPGGGHSGGGADLLTTGPRPQANSCPSELEADLLEEGGEPGSLDSGSGQGRAQMLHPKRPSLYTLRHSLRRRANTLGGTLVQGAQAVGSGVGSLGGTLVHGAQAVGTGVGNLGGTLVQGAQAVGGTLTTGAKAVAKMPQNLVNMSSGLFAVPSPHQGAESGGVGSLGVLDIQESWFGNDEAGNRQAEQMRKRQQNYALLARLQQKTAEQRQQWMNMFACATAKEEHPNLFAPVEDMLPYPRQLYSDLCTELPYYLCIRLDERRRHRKAGTRESHEDYEFGNKTKSEFWFTVPRDKADTLYAFLIQWTPDLSAEEESGGGNGGGGQPPSEKRYADEGVDSTGKNMGFVVLDVNDDDAVSVNDSYSNQPGSIPINLNLNREWEIVTVEEVKRRLSLMDLLESEQQPLAEGSELSGLLDEEKIRCLMDVLPARAQGYPWALVYSSETNGFSLRTLYRNMQQWNEEISPTLLVIKDTNGRLFGAIVNCPIRVSEHFYGSGESLLFTFHPEFAYFRWTGENNFIVKGNMDSLSFGAGRGVYGLWLDGDLYHGRTQHCQTFDNLPLAGEEDFTMAGVEAWGFSLGAF